MKTLFTTKKAIALFNCKSSNASTNSIRCHIYNLQNELEYNSSFVITDCLVTAEEITQVNAKNHIIELIAQYGKSTITYTYNTLTNQLIKNEAIEKPMFWGKRLLKMASLY